MPSGTGSSSRGGARCGPGFALGREVVEGDPFEIVRSLLPPAPGLEILADSAGSRSTSLLTCPLGSRPSSLPFLGGAVGYFGYELAEFVEAVTSSGRNDLELPDLCLLFVDRLLAFDHLEGRAFAVGLGFAAGRRVEAARRAQLAACRSLLSAMEDAEGQPSAPRRPPRRRGPADLAALPGLSSPATRMLSRRRQLLATEPPASAGGHFRAGSYAKSVEIIREEIAAGNVYQANLTQRLDLALEGNGAHCDEAWSLYRVSCAS